MEVVMSKGETVTRVVLAECVSDKLPSLTARESADVVNSIVDIVSETLASNQEVKISGFGRFYLRDKNARKGRNPQTGEEIEIRARRVLGFKASDSLRQTINAKGGIQ